MLSAPSVTVIVATLDSEQTLGAALSSLDAQRYDGEVEVLCVDGGSGDNTLEIAHASGAIVIENPAGNEEEARAIGVERASGELLLMMDADNELPHSGWLARLAAAFELADDVVAADCLYHAHRRDDRPLTRLCGLIGGVDPLAVELGYSDRWAWHLGRWTAMPVDEEDRGEALLVSLDPSRPPPLGSNGFLVRRSEVLRTRYRPFIHSDVVGDLAELGWRFARVRDEVVHHYADTLGGYARKMKRRARRVATGVPQQRRGFDPPPGRTLAVAASSMLVVRPALLAARGFLRQPDRAWALYPLLLLIATLAYASEILRALVLRGHRRAPPGLLGRSSEPRLADFEGLVSVVMPAFNEATTVERNLCETFDALERLGCRHEVIVVDDGSSDETPALVARVASRRASLRLIRLGENTGKGFALVRGASEARGDLVLFLDADLEVHPRQLGLLYEVLVRERVDLVIGSKLHPRARIDYPPRRRVVTLAYYLLVRGLFRLPVRDTQTGLKLYRREVLDAVVPLLLVKRFAHDLEVLVNAHRLGFRIAEAPVVVTRERPYPRIGLGDVRNIAIDTAAIWYRTYLLHYYDRRQGQSGCGLSEAPRIGSDPGPTDAVSEGVPDRLDDRST